MALEGIRLTAPPFRGGKIVSPLLFQGGGTTQALIGLDSGNKLKIIRGSDVAGASGITIDTSGNVGIGTTNPLKNLHVIGRVNINTNDTVWGDSLIVGGGLGVLSGRINTGWGVPLQWYSSNGQLSMDTPTGQRRVLFGLYPAGNETGLIVFKNFTTGATPMVFDVTNGNVGIGTTAPETRLDVVGIVQPRRVGDADSANTLKNSFPLQLQGAYWNGAASVKRHGQVLLQMISVSPQARIAFQVEGVDLGGLDEAIADGETALLLRRNVGGTFSLVRVSMGAPDSGGVGYRLLRVPN